MGEPRAVALTRGFVALVSPEDYDRVAAFKWCAWVSKRRPGLVYGRRTFRVPGEPGKWGCVWLHRFIVGARPSRLVDHRDHDGLNNQRGNLRECDNRRNQQNVRSSANQKRGGFKGVVFHKSSGAWYAQIRAGAVRPDGKRAHIKAGPFASPIEAARAYDELAREHFGEWAAPNFELATDVLSERLAEPASGGARG